jgi:hypothetical protein
VAAVVVLIQPLEQVAAERLDHRRAEPVEHNLLAVRAELQQTEFLA